MHLLVVGTSHRTAPAHIRDALHMTPDSVAAFLAAMELGNGALTEVAVLSTCNRTEIYALAPNAKQACLVLREQIETHSGVDHLSDPKHAYTKSGEQVVKHLLRVAAGLDSLLIGEPQILGQVRESFELAQTTNTTGPVLNRLFATAVRMGKKARSQTAISEGAVSVAYAAVQIAAKVFADLTTTRVLIVGAGETGALAARHFNGHKVRQLRIVNRSAERAQELAATLEGEALEWDQLGSAIAQADIIVSATSAPGYVIDKATVQKATIKRYGKPLVMIDIASPRDIDPAVANLDDVFHYDLDTLESITAENQRLRAAEIPKVERIVNEGCERFMVWFHALGVTPTLTALRQSMEIIALAEARKHGHKVGGGNTEALERYTMALLNKLLHEPTVRAKQLDLSQPGALGYLEALRELFALDVPTLDSAKIHLRDSKET